MCIRLKRSLTFFLTLAFLCISTSTWAQGKRCKPGTVLVGFDQNNQLLCEPLFKVLKSTDPQTFEKEILPWLDKQLATYREENDDDFLPIKSEFDLPKPRQSVSRKVFLEFWVKNVRIVPHFKAGKPMGFKIISIRKTQNQFMFQKGDIITHVNANSQALDALQSALNQDKDSISFTILRAQKKSQLTFDFVD